MFDGAEAVRETIENAEELRPEPPRPLIRELPPADPFPVDALGSLLGAATEGINDRVRSPMAICAQSTLAAATLVAQGHADVRLPTGQVKPISDFFLTVAETGERKSATDHEALEAFRKRENLLREGYDGQSQQFENATVAWEEARAKTKQNAKGDRDKIISEFDKIGAPPTAPLSPILTCPEPTYEGLVKHLVTGQPIVGIFSAEGGQFIGGHGMTDEAMLRTAAGLSSIWDGEPIKRIRAKDGTIILFGRRVSLHLMAQPDVAATMLSHPLLLSQGLLSRCLVSAPEASAGTRFWREPEPGSAVAIRRYNTRISAMLEAPLPLVEKKNNELSPRPLPLSADSRRLWIGFSDNIEAQIAPDGALCTIRGLANKIPEHAARLAAVLALVADIEAAEISAEHMEAGIVLAQHYVAEALRMFEGSRIDANLLLAAKLLAWLNGFWDEAAISLPDIYQKGPNGIRDKATASRLVKILEDHGWLVQIPDGTVVAGQRRRDAWRIIKG